MRHRSTIVFAVFAGLAALAPFAFPTLGPLFAQPTADVETFSSDIGSSEIPELTNVGSLNPTVKELPDTQGSSEEVNEEGYSARRILTWLWNLADKKDGATRSDLGKAAVFAIALLAAFLTVVEVWQIPPPRRRLRRSDDGEEEPARGGPSAEPAAGAADPSSSSAPTNGTATLLYTSNFARTVLSGLAGMTLVATFDGFWKDDQNGFAEEPLYLVLFVIFFLVFLVLSAVFRSVTEAVRSRVSLVRRAAPAGHPWRRFWTWLLSLRVPALVFLDTGFNVIQGKNQLQTAAFEHDIVELHASIVAAVCRIRERLDQALLNALKDKDKDKDATRQNASVRVSISLMSSDESAVFYVARETGSLAKPFGRDSIAWLSLHTGLPLWYRKSWEPDSTVLIENSDRFFNDLPAKRLLLRDYWEKRNQSDYQAFVVLPLPWGHRGEAEGYRKAGIHICFRDEGDMSLIWPALNKPPEKIPKDTHKHPDFLGDEKDSMEPQLATTLQVSADVLTELFRYFNGLVFEEQVRPTLRPN